MEQPIEDVIKKYLETREVLYTIEKEIETFFRVKIQPDLEKAETADDFHRVKCLMYDMPECASKVLIFRTILIYEDRKLGNA